MIEHSDYGTSSGSTPCENRYALSRYEQALLQAQVTAVPVTVSTEFQQAYAAWVKTWGEPEVAKSSDPGLYAKSPEFQKLVALGTDIVPLLMEKLCDPTQFFALQAVQALLSDRIIFWPTMEDIAVIGGEQYRAFGTIQRWLLALDWQAARGKVP
ncbi:MAG: hypothetical protein AAF533_18340 [Acidobacteriota bacterium]